jgi:hypothetical protein
MSSFVGYDDAGHFVHGCEVCGIDAPFGYRVALRKGELGRWFCREHRPDPVQGAMTLIAATSDQCAPHSLNRECKSPDRSQDDLFACHVDRDRREGVPLGRLALAARIKGME